MPKQLISRVGIGNGEFLNLRDYVAHQLLGRFFRLRVFTVGQCIPLLDLLISLRQLQNIGTLKFFLILEDPDPKTDSTVIKRWEISPQMLHPSTVGGWLALLSLIDFQAAMFLGKGFTR